MSKKNDGNIEFIIDFFNIDSKNGVKRGHSIPYHHQQSMSCRCYSFDDNFFEVDVPV